MDYKTYISLCRRARLRVRTHTHIYVRTHIIHSHTHTHTYRDTERVKEKVQARERSGQTCKQTDRQHFCWIRITLQNWKQARGEKYTYIHTWHASHLPTRLSNTPNLSTNKAVTIQTNISKEGRKRATCGVSTGTHLIHCWQWRGFCSQGRWPSQTEPTPTTELAPHPHPVVRWSHKETGLFRKRVCSI